MFFLPVLPNLCPPCDTPGISNPTTSRRGSLNSRSYLGHTRDRSIARQLEKESSDKILDFTAVGCRVHSDIFYKKSARGIVHWNLHFQSSRDSLFGGGIEQGSLTFLGVDYILVIVYYLDYSYSIQTKERRARCTQALRKSLRQPEYRHAPSLPHSFLRCSWNTLATPRAARVASRGRCCNRLLFPIFFFLKVPKGLSEEPQKKWVCPYLKISRASMRSGRWAWGWRGVHGEVQM